MTETLRETVSALFKADYCVDMAIQDDRDDLRLPANVIPPCTLFRYWLQDDGQRGARDAERWQAWRELHA